MIVGIKKIKDNNSSRIAKKSDGDFNTEIEVFQLNIMHHTLHGIEPQDNGFVDLFNNGKINDAL